MNEDKTQGNTWWWHDSRQMNKKSQ